MWKRIILIALLLTGQQFKLECPWVKKQILSRYSLTPTEREREGNSLLLLSPSKDGLLKGSSLEHGERINCSMMNAIPTIELPSPAEISLGSLLVLITVPLGVALFKWLWNSTMPQVFDLKEITFWQAFRLILIASFLFKMTSSS